MAEVLYRKYRSQNFAEIVGQQLIVQILKSSVASGQIAHAYLFTGPRGTGKTSCARIFAKAINCQNSKTGDACGECGNCKAIAEGEFLDIIEIDAASNRGVNEIRELKEKVSFAPAQGAYKVYIIDEVHMLTKEAFNALLKTLEEPPAQVVFIFATTEVQKMPVTILSRVVRLDFRLASNSELEQKLTLICEAEGIKVEKGALVQLIRLARGSFRDAESLLEKVIQAVKTKVLSPESVASSLGVNIEADLLEILTLLNQARESSDEAKLLELDQRLQLIFSSGLNPQHFLADMVEITTQQILLSYGAESPKEVSNLKLPRKLLFKLVQTAQELIINYQKYLDPLIFIRLKFLELAAGSESVVFSGPVVGQSKEPSPSNQPLKTKTLVEPFTTEKKLKTELIPKENTVDVVTESIQAVTQILDQSSVSYSDSSTAELINLVFNVDNKLASILKQSLFEFKSNTLFIKVPTKFHYTIINQVKSRQILQTSLAKLLSSDAQIQIVQIEKSKLATDQVNNPVVPVSVSQDNSTLVENLFSDML